LIHLVFGQKSPVPTNFSNEGTLDVEQVTYKVVRLKPERSIDFQVKGWAMPENKGGYRRSVGVFASSFQAHT
jgi:hypothetical protein